MSAPTGEKLILLRGSRFECYDSEIDWTYAWFILKYDGNRIQVLEIFKDLEPLLGPGFHVKDANCVQIGSSLYLLGGRHFDTDTASWSQLSFCVRRFNTENPAEDWKICNMSLDECDRAAVGVAGNVIYLFPRSSRGPYGCLYDAPKDESPPITFY